jgi:acetyl esterase/lipase
MTLRLLAIISLAIALSQSILCRAQELNGKKNPNLPEDATTYLNLSYGTHDRHKLDIAIPRGPGPHPVIVWIHGGAWEMGSKGGFGPATVHQVARGYAVVGINYRFSQHAVFPAQILDVKDAIRYLKKNAETYKLDPNRIGVLGASAGGHLAVLLGTSNGVKELDRDGAKPDETKIACIIDLFGPADLFRLSPPGSPENPVTKLLGGDIAGKRDLCKLATPQTHADKSDPPVLIMHGDKDLIVPVSQSEELQQSLKSAGVVSQLIIIKGGGHGPGFSAPSVFESMNAFFDTHLKK